MMRSVSGDRSSQLTIAVSSSFTAEPVRDTLRFWSEHFGFNANINMAPYSQVFQQLLDPNSTLSADHNDLNLVLIRPDDWIRDLNGRDQLSLTDHVNSVLGDLKLALLKFAEHVSVPTVLMLTKPAPDSFFDQEKISELYANLKEITDSHNSIMVLGPDDIDRLYPVADPHDQHRDKLGHIPYTDEYFSALASAAFRKHHNYDRKPAKVVVLDCDNTLWKGVCGEAGAYGVEITEGHKYLQQFMIRQMESGKVLCLCSKNVPEDVNAVFDQRNDMLLTEDHIVASKVNWQPKSRNIRELSDELSLGLDSFIFVDDNPVECAEVKAACPEVLTLCLPEDDAQIPSFLDHVWAFDTDRVTGTDRKRTQMYKDNISRNKFKNSAGSLRDFIDGLNLQIEIKDALPEELERVSQLSMRTNQFNFTTIRRNTDEMRALYHSREHRVLTCRVKDRFGDYGLVGVLICKKDGDLMIVDSFMLSCRVLGRGVEYRMLAKAAEVSMEEGCAKTAVRFQSTEKNLPAEQFLRTVCGQFEIRADELSRACIHFDAKQLSDLGFDPDHMAEDSRPENRSAISDRTGHAAIEADHYEKIAKELNTATLIQRRASGKEVVTEQKVGPAGIEKDEERTIDAIRGIWEDILGIGQVETDAHFFDVGGTSLKAVEVLSRINETFDKDLSIVSLFEHSTIRSLADMVEGENEEDDELQQILRKAGSRRLARRRRN